MRSQMKRFTPMTALSLGALLMAACSNAAPPPAAVTDSAWTLSGTESSLDFLTIKSGSIVEAHLFTGLKGEVTAAGAASVEINLDSVETHIDIRNERMREHLFETAAYPAATASLQLNPADFSGLAIGEQMNFPATLTLSLHGMDQEIEADLTITRVSADKVQVASSTPIIIHAEDFALEAGIEKLRELAGLPAITAQVPVTFSLTFTRG